MKKLSHAKPILAILLSFCIHVVMHGQVTGTVTSDDGSPLIGVNITKKGTTEGVITDLDGNYTMNANDGDVLVFSYIGSLSQKVTVGGSNLNIQMSEDATTLSDIVVTATRQPIRRIQSTTAITSIGKEELQVMKPETFGEALVNTPGVTVYGAQGRKTEINIRGFPSGNTYLTVMKDGLPISALARFSAGSSEFFGLDPGVEAIEVVRGSAATLFGRAAAAGAINIIAKTGGEETKGSFSFTKFNNVMGEGHQFEGDFDWRADFNINGAFTDKLRYNLGMFLMEDSGIKESAYKDGGGQLSFNLDYLMSEKSKIRVYGVYTNNQFQNITDIPYDFGKNELADGWENNNVYFNDARVFNFESRAVTSVFAPPMFQTPQVDVNGNQLTNNAFADGGENVDGGTIGIDATFDLGNGWSFNEKFKYQKFGWRDGNEFALASFYTAESALLRLNAIGNMNTRDIINEARINKSIEGGTINHSLTGGLYLSHGYRDRLPHIHWYTATVDPRPTFGWFGPPGTPPPAVHTLSAGSTGIQTEKATGLFIGDEMLINEKFSLNLALRYDILISNITNNPGEINGVDLAPIEPSDTGDLEFSDYSYSIGFNYLFAERSAIYGNHLRAFSLPQTATFIPEKNEIINNFEIGYRSGFGDLGIDISGFYTKIDNRIATVFDGENLFVQTPVGQNIVNGAEIALTYAPSSIKGLLFRANYTLQHSVFKDFIVPLDKIDTDGDQVPDSFEASLDNLFGLDLVQAGDNAGIDVSGNQIFNTPKTQITFNVSYNTPKLGLNFGGLMYDGRYATALNLYELPTLSIFNAAATYKIPYGDGNFSIGVTTRNLFNSKAAQALFVGSAFDDLLVQKQKTPDFNGILGFGTVQAPRRVLLTVGYNW